MNTFIMILMGLAFVTVLAGFGVMVVGGQVNERFGTKMMALRVALQASAIALLAIVAMMAG